MMLLPVGYLGYVYWDKHHRGRRRTRQRHNDHHNNNNNDNQGPEEPPSFGEFLSDYVFYPASTKDSHHGTLLVEEKDVANAIIAELSQVVGGSVTVSSSSVMDDEPLGIALSSSSSSSFSVSSFGSREQGTDDSDDGDNDTDEKKKFRYNFMTLPDGLEYELQEQQRKEQQEADDEDDNKESVMRCKKRP